MSVGTFHEMFSDIVGATARARLFRRPLKLVELGREPGRLGAHLFLERLGERLVGLAPFRKTHHLDVLRHRFRNRPVEVTRIGRSENAPLHFGVGHHRRRFRGFVGDVE